MARVLFNIFRILLVIILLVLIGIAIYTLFFTPSTSTKTVTQDVELSE